MKVVLVTPSFAPSINGLANVVTKQAEWLRDKGCEVLVVVPGNESYQYRGITVRGFDLRGAFTFRSPLRGSIIRFIRELRSVDYDIIVCHAFQVGIVDLALLAFRRNCIYYSHGVSWASRITHDTLSGWLRLINYLPYRVVAPLILGRVRGAVFLGRDSKNDRTLDHFLCRRAVKHYSRNASDLPPVSPKNFDNILKINLLVVGAYSREKGFDRLEELLPRICKGKVESLTICSFGSAGLDDFERRISKLGLDFRVDFVRNKSGSQLFPHYLSSDIFLNLSHSECYPLVVADALNARLPIVSYDVGYQSEISGTNLVKSVADVAEFINTWPSNRKRLADLSAETDPVLWDKVFQEFYSFASKLVACGE